MEDNHPFKAIVKEAILSPAMKFGATFAHVLRYSYCLQRKWKLTYISLDETKQRFISVFCYLNTQLVTLYGHWIPISTAMERCAPYMFTLLTTTCSQDEAFSFMGVEKLNDPQKPSSTNIPPILCLILQMYAYDRTAAFTAPSESKKWDEYVLAPREDNINQHIDQGKDFFDVINPIHRAYFDVPVGERGSKIAKIRGKCWMATGKKNDQKPGNHVDSMWDDNAKFQFYCRFSKETFAFHEYIHALCTGGFRNPSEVAIFDRCTSLEKEASPIPRELMVKFEELKERHRMFLKLWETIESSFSCFHKTKKVRTDVINVYDEGLNMLMMKRKGKNDIISNFLSLFEDRDPIDHERLRNPEPEPSDDEDIAPLPPLENPTDSNPGSVVPLGESNNQESSVPTVQQTQTQQSSIAPAGSLPQLPPLPNQGNATRTTTPATNAPAAPSTGTEQPAQTMRHSNIDASISASNQRLLKGKKRTINSVSSDAMAEGLHSAALEAMEIHYPTDSDVLTKLIKEAKVNPDTELYQRTASVWHDAAVQVFSNKLKSLDPSASQAPTNVYHSLPKSCDPNEFLTVNTEAAVVSQNEIREAEDKSKEQELRIQELESKNKQLELSLNLQKDAHQQTQQKVQVARDMMMELALNQVVSNTVLETFRNGETWDDSRRPPKLQLLPEIENDIIKRALEEGKPFLCELYRDWLFEFVEVCFRDVAEKKLWKPLTNIANLRDEDERQQEEAASFVKLDENLWVQFCYYLRDYSPKDEERGGQYVWNEETVPEKAQRSLVTFECNVSVEPPDQCAKEDQEQNFQAAVDHVLEICDIIDQGALPYIKGMAVKFCKEFFSTDPTIVPKNWHSKYTEMLERLEKLNLSQQEMEPEPIPQSAANGKKMSL